MRLKTTMKLKQVLKSIETDYKKTDLPKISIGDVIRVNVFIQESSKTRVQAYRGTVTSYHRAGLNSTITVRRVSKGVGIDRIFPLHSPDIQSIEVLERTRKESFV